jgi:hypothetical protein
MAEGTREDLIGAEESAMHTCERCDQPSRHLIKLIGMDNRPHYVCWSCRNREEKRINLKSTWKRGGRQR